MWIQQDIKQKTDMLDREDEGVSTGDEVYEEEEDAITTMTDAFGAVSLDDAPITTHTAILDSTVTVDTQMTTAKR